MGAYATVDDVESMFRTLTDEEKIRCEALLPDISDALRQEALNRGKYLDGMISDGLIIQSVIKSVVVDIAARSLLTSTTIEPMTQITESALGYSFTGSPTNQMNKTFWISNKDLSRIGLLRQRVEAWKLWE